MTLRLIQSSNQNASTQPSTPQPSTTSQSDCSTLQPLFANLVRLDTLRPAMIDVISGLVSDILDDLEGRRP